jgi:hypothetical protein
VHSRDNIQVKRRRQVQHKHIKGESGGQSTFGMNMIALLLLRHK